METESQDAQQDQIDDPDPQTDDAEEFAERQQEEEESRGHGPADGSGES
jgi:hypothetical protein